MSRDWVLHDLRRTTATKLAELRVPPHVTEKILNHSASRTVGPMGKIYQRYDYLEERREALELWAAALDVHRRRQQGRTAPGELKPPG